MAKTKDTPQRTQAELDVLAKRLAVVGMDLCALRRLSGVILNDSPDVQQAAELAHGIDAIVTRAGRAVEECAVALGEREYCSWPDYPEFERDEEAANEA